MERVNGLHHITAISGPAQENVDFYAGMLGMHLVKRSVNQDDPGTYHLFYADAEGSPGSDLTFFPWPPPALRRGSVTGSPSRRASKCRREASTTGPRASSKYGVKTRRHRDSLRRSAPSRRRHAWLSSHARRKREPIAASRSRRGTAARCRRTPGARPLWRAAVGTKRRPHQPISHEDPRPRADGHRGRLDALRLPRRGWSRGHSPDARPAPRRVGRRYAFTIWRGV